jgi:hypothetical protein
MRLRKDKSRKTPRRSRLRPQEAPPVMGQAARKALNTGSIRRPRPLAHKTALYRSIPASIRCRCQRRERSTAANCIRVRTLLAALHSMCSTRMLPVQSGRVRPEACTVEEGGRGENLHPLPRETAEQLQQGSCSHYRGLGLMCFPASTGRGRMYTTMEPLERTTRARARCKQPTRKRRV